MVPSFSESPKIRASSSRLVHGTWGDLVGSQNLHSHTSEGAAFFACMFEDSC